MRYVLRIRVQAVRNESKGCTLKTGNCPTPPRCPLGAIQPNQVDAEAIKRQAWERDGILVVSIDNPALDWTDRKLLENIARRIYGT